MRTFIAVVGIACVSAFTVYKSATAPNQANSLAVASTPPVRVNGQLQDIKGVISWDMLAKVEQKSVKDRIYPVFSKEIMALNAREVKIQGFMMPLDPGRTQKHFLLSVNSSTCPYCMPAGPEGVVDVLSAVPINYGYEPIIVSGKLAVLQDDPAGVFYKMTNAVLASAN